MTTTRVRSYAPEVIVAAGCLIALITFGPRASAGLFQIPMTVEHGWGRDIFGLALAIQNLLWGLGSPFAGAIADRYGTVKVLCTGALLYAAGRESQAAVRPGALPVRETIRVGDGARWIEVSPSAELRISYTLDVDHPAVGIQVASVVPSEKVFVEELSGARTYGFLKDLELLRQQGLALGGSLENAVVVGQERVLNGTLRFRDEFVRHKILDVVGDLALIGRPIVGHVVARNAGHALNHQRSISRVSP